MKWAYGVTTVPSRRDNLLPKTLYSLALAGFDKPWLFVDGATGFDFVMPGQPSASLASNPGPIAGLTLRGPSPVRTFGTWVLALWELWARNPTAERFAIFQDDLVAVKGLREYLSNASLSLAYLNLYTFPSNQSICPQGHVGWYPSNQLGRGALALVFTLPAVQALLGHPVMVERPRDVHHGTSSVDGAISTAMKDLGFIEYVHNPSLVQHTGAISTMGNPPHYLSPSFPGEDFHCSQLSGVMT